MFYPIISSQEYNIVSTIKAMIKTHIAEKAVRLFPRDNLKIIQSDSVT